MGCHPHQDHVLPLLSYVQLLLLLWLLKLGIELWTKKEKKVRFTFPSYIFHRKVLHIGSLQLDLDWVYRKRLYILEGLRTQ
jgi:hypothetical protein